MHDGEFGSTRVPFYCFQSLPGVTHLEKHVREEHSDSATGKMKANFKQFIGKAKHTLTSKTRVLFPLRVS